MERSSDDTRSGRSTGTAVGLFVLVASCLPQHACSGPISTMRSPYHLRTVEVRNATEEARILKIEPAASQHLGAATTFTGVLRPGETKSLYLYHGFEYHFRILETAGDDQLTHRTVQVDRDSGLVYAGDSLRAETALAAGPETTRGQSIPIGARRASERERRERQGKLQTGGTR